LIPLPEFPHDPRVGRVREEQRSARSTGWHSDDGITRARFAEPDSMAMVELIERVLHVGDVEARKEPMIADEVGVHAELREMRLLRRYVLDTGVADDRQAPVGSRCCGVRDGDGGHPEDAPVEFGRFPQITHHRGRMKQAEDPEARLSGLAGNPASCSSDYGLSRRRTQSRIPELVPDCVMLSSSRLSCQASCCGGSRRRKAEQRSRGRPWRMTTERVRFTPC
jgi:hypothetical protein